MADRQRTSPCSHILHGKVRTSFSPSCAPRTAIVHSLTRCVQIERVALSADFESEAVEDDESLDEQATDDLQEADISCQEIDDIWSLPPFDPDDNIPVYLSLEGNYQAPAQVSDSGLGWGGQQGRQADDPRRSRQCKHASPTDALRHRLEDFVEVRSPAELLAAWRRHCKEWNVATPRLLLIGDRSLCAPARAASGLALTLVALRELGRLGERKSLILQQCVATQSGVVDTWCAREGFLAQYKIPNALDCDNPEFGLDLREQPLLRCVEAQMRLPNSIVAVVVETALLPSLLQRWSGEQVLAAAVVSQRDHADAFTAQRIGSLMSIPQVLKLQAVGGWDEQPLCLESLVAALAS